MRRTAKHFRGRPLRQKKRETCMKNLNKLALFVALCAGIAIAQSTPQGSQSTPSSSSPSTQQAPDQNTPAQPANPPEQMPKTDQSSTSQSSTADQSSTSQSSTS